MSEGFYYTLEDNKIKEYMKLTTKQKLKWLEEINEFTEKVLTLKDKKNRNRLIGTESLV